jgi:hypothetical protein
MSKRIRSKSKYRTARRRSERRVNFDIETRGVMGDSHIGRLDQLLTYAVAAGMTAGDEVVIVHMGDHINDCRLKPHHLPMDEAHIKRCNQEIARMFAPRMDWPSIRDERRDPATGRIMPVRVNDEDE